MKLILDYDANWQDVSTDQCSNKVTRTVVQCSEDVEPETITCYNGNCGGSSCNPLDRENECSEEEQALMQNQVEKLTELFRLNTGNSVVFPTSLIGVQFCDGTTRFLLPAEMSLHIPPPLTPPFRKVLTP